MTGIDEAASGTTPIRELQGRLNAENLPILLLNDPDFDETCVDFSEPETVTITQVDEYGKQHTVVLSAAIINNIIPNLVIWQRNASVDDPQP